MCGLGLLQWHWVITFQYDSSSTSEATMKNMGKYRKTSSISHTKSQNLTVSRVVLQLSLPNPLKPGVKSSMKM